MDREKPDHFPKTMNTWIGQKLEEGERGRAEINHYIMSVYAEPLQIYFRGSTVRAFGDPEEMVQGFFADRLARSDFFRKWQQSGKRLRYWLINAFNFYLKEYLRARGKAAAEDLPEDVLTCTSDAETQIDQAFMISIVRQALQKAQQLCEAQGLGEHWQVFLRHKYEDQPYKNLEGEFQEASDRLIVMSRTAERRFKAVLRELFAKEWRTPKEIDQEIQSLLEVASS